MLSWFNTTVLTCLGLVLNVDYGVAFSCRVKNKTVKPERLLVEERERFDADYTGSSVVLLTRFEDYIVHVASDVVGVLLTVEEAILGLAQGAAGDISSTADGPENSSGMNEKSASRSQNPRFSYSHNTG